MKITSDPAYQHHQGKPVVAIWGIGFNDTRLYSIEECGQLIQFFKKLNCTVMLGVPTGWRTLDRDAVSDPNLIKVIKQADIISPWTVGRFQIPADVKRHAKRDWKTDQLWCQSQQLDYMPVIFPGFSWQHLSGGKLDSIPRLQGKFFWSQVVGAKTAGCNMIYIAMFDEVDEGTAIFKCTNKPPSDPNTPFLTYEGLPSDFYLKLAGAAGKVLRGEIPLAEKIPIISTEKIKK